MNMKDIIGIRTGSIFNEERKPTRPSTPPSRPSTPTPQRDSPRPSQSPGREEKSMPRVPVNPVKK